MTTRALRGINCQAKATTGAPSAGTWEVGDLVCDSAGTYYVCTTAGTPGTWTALAGGGTPVLWGRPNSTVSLVAGGSATANAHHFVQLGSDATITLPAAASNNGTICAFEMRASGTVQATLDAGVGVNIAGRSRYLVLLNTNVVMLYCNGTDWFPMILCLDTPWVDGGATTITATTTNPTKGTMSVDKVWWRRIGDSIDLRYEFHQSTAGTAGSGTYLLGLPGSFSADAAKIRQTTTENDTPTVGACTYNVGGSIYPGTVRLRNSAIICTAVTGGTNSEFTWGSGGGALSNANLRMMVSASVPVTNW